MHYEINVAKNGLHLFATAERSLTNKADLREVFAKLKDAFPESEGYALSVSQRWSAGVPVPIIDGVPVPKD